MFKFITQGAQAHENPIWHHRPRAPGSSSCCNYRTLALSSFTAEAQGNPGAVANLQLTSTTAGTLTVSWDAASPVPTDYRIDWTKSGEDYKSWKVDDGHV